MSDTVTTMTEGVAECPICIVEFDESSNIPRRMPCCEQPICEICLTSYISGRRRFPCPLCRVNADLPDGVNALPKDMTVLQTRGDSAPTCTDCPDQNKAMAKCDECRIDLCEPCLQAHVRNRSTRFHATSPFDDVTTTTLHNTNRDREESSTVDPSELKAKLDKVTLRMKNLSVIGENINLSEQRATEQIKERFDDILKELKHRSGILLFQVKSIADRQRTSIKQALDSHRTLQEKLNSSSVSGHAAVALLTEIPEDVDADRIGVTFTEVNMRQLLSTIRSAGQVRVVTFSPTERPSFVPEDRLYNALKIHPTDFPEGVQTDEKLSIEGKDVIGPYLEFDQNTASANVQISPRVVSNISPDPVLQDTGCRFQSWRRVLALRPLFLGRSQVVVFSTRVVFTVKQLTDEGTSIWETSVTEKPVDANRGQVTGLGLVLKACATHKKQLCLWVGYDGKLLADVPLTLNQIGVSHHLHLCIMANKDAKHIHVVDVTDAKLVTSTEASLDRPLWVLMYVDRPSDTEMTSELISGNEITLSPQMKVLMSSLI